MDKLFTCAFICMYKWRPQNVLYSMGQRNALSSNACAHLYLFPYLANPQVIKLINQSTSSCVGKTRKCAERRVSTSPCKERYVLCNSGVLHMFLHIMSYLHFSYTTSHLWGTLSIKRSHYYPRFNLFRSFFSDWGYLSGAFLTFL